MNIVAGVGSWSSGATTGATTDIAAGTVARSVAEAWMAAAPHCSVRTFALPDGNPRSADAVDGQPIHAGGAHVVKTPSGLILAPRDGKLRWNPQDLATALLGLAASARADGTGTTVIIPVGDAPPAGDATDVWGGGLPVMRRALEPLTIIVLVRSARPLLGFKGMSAALRDGRENDAALATAAQEQEQRWNAIALDADPLASRPMLVGSSRLSDAPGSGAAGGLAYCLGAVGGQLTPASAFLAEFTGFATAAAHADLVVGVSQELTPTELDHGVASPVAKAAASGAIPCIVLAPTVHVGKRDLMAAGISSAYEAGEGLEALTVRVGRVARTWSPAPQ